MHYSKFEATRHQNSLHKQEWVLMSVSSGIGSNVLALDYPQCQEKVITNTTQDKE
jgi:hypothetical protein